MKFSDIPQSLRARCKVQPDSPRHADAPFGVALRIPIRIYSEANLREHWSAKARRAKHQREMVAAHFRANGGPLPRFPVSVKLVRYGKKLLDSADNLPIGFKHVVDEIAAIYGVDDGDPRWTWAYEQEQSREYGILVVLSNR
jgi:hypothetical protein